MSDLWHWRAVYDDGSHLDEYGDDAPEGRGFNQIDLDRLAYFQLISQTDALPDHMIQILPAFRPIFYRRVFVETNGETNDEVGRTKVHILGLQTTANGKNVPFYVFYFPDGSSLISNDYQAI